MSIHAQQVISPTIVDPNNVPEIFVNGPINIQMMGSIAVITFTSVKSDAKQAFKGNPSSFYAVVNARLTMPLEMTVQLREVPMIQPVPMPSMSTSLKQ